MPNWTSWSTRWVLNPTRSELVRATLRGIKRTRGCSQRQAKALLRDDLVLVLGRNGRRTEGHAGSSLAPNRLCGGAPPVGVGRARYRRHRACPPRAPSLPCGDPRQIRMARAARLQFRRRGTLGVHRCPQSRAQPSENPHGFAKLACVSRSSRGTSACSFGEEPGPLEFG